MGKITGLLCSLYLSAGYMGELPVDINDYNYGSDGGYSRRLKHRGDRNAIAEALSHMSKSRARYMEEFYLTPEYVHELVLEARTYPDVPQNLTVEQFLSVWASVYEVDRDN